MSRLPPPVSDYLTDTRLVLDNSARLAQVRVCCDAELFVLGAAQWCACDGAPV
jgi:hypothetical protein